jgi:hypothetical protein
VCMEPNSGGTVFVTKELWVGIVAEIKGRRRYVFPLKLILI